MLREVQEAARKRKEEKEKKKEEEAPQGEVKMSSNNLMVVSPLAGLQSGETKTADRADRRRKAIKFWIGRAEELDRKAKLLEQVSAAQKELNPAMRTYVTTPAATAAIVGPLTGGYAYHKTRNPRTALITGLANALAGAGISAGVGFARRDAPGLAAKARRRSAERYRQKAEKATGENEEGKTGSAPMMVIPPAQGLLIELEKEAKVDWGQIGQGALKALPFVGAALGAWLLSKKRKKQTLMGPRKVRPAGAVGKGVLGGLLGLAAGALLAKGIGKRIGPKPEFELGKPGIIGAGAPNVAEPQGIEWPVTV